MRTTLEITAALIVALLAGVLIAAIVAPNRPGVAPAIAAVSWLAWLAVFIAKRWGPAVDAARTDHYRRHRPD